MCGALHTPQGVSTFDTINVFSRMTDVLTGTNLHPEEEAVLRGQVHELCVDVLNAERNGFNPGACQCRKYPSFKALVALGSWNQRSALDM